MRGRLLLVAAAVLAISAPLALASPGLRVADATTTNTAYVIWAPGTAHRCDTQVDHRVAYGGALASTWTPHPVYGGTACWSTYSTVHSTGGSATSAGGNPSSAVVVAGATPTSSEHLACYGLFDCDATWYVLP